MESETVSETQSLISPTLYSMSFIRRLAWPGRHLLPGPWYRWQLSKQVLAIIFINCIVGVPYATMMIAAQKSQKEISSSNILIWIIGVSLFIALFNTLFSPLSGLLADVRFGRYRILFVGICMMFGATLIISLIAVFRLFVTVGVWKMKFYVDNVQPVLFALAAVALFLFMPGFAGYQANFIPFGLNQLLEAPSTALSLFIHLIVWAERLGIFVVQIIDAIYECEQWSNNLYLLPFSFILSLAMAFILIIVCLRKCQFNTETQQHNPYKMIYKVLVYIRKHRYPLQRSAFTYCDDEIPSRFDFAKERYGGPFTTEQVEDVKIFFKILLVLLALGPVFVLEIPVSLFITIIFIHHIGDISSASVNGLCSARFVLLEKSSIVSLTTLILLPLFIWIVFCFLHQCVLSIFSRLRFAVLIYLLGVASMFCIDLVGHIRSEVNSPNNTSMCMFVIHHGFQQPMLELHWAVLLAPSVLLGLGPPLVMATTFEFISAQSPFSLKGLLVGIFFSIRAFFQLVSGIVLIPFAYNPLWDSPYMREHPPVANCGFGYLLFTCVVALIGLVLLSVVARRYKYRERDDRPYDQRFVVDVYERYLEQACENNVK